MTSSSNSYRAIPNQFIISIDEATYFQSYDSVIACKRYADDGEESLTVYLDINKWDYSMTTGKYRNQFLGEDKKATEKKIADGTYKFIDLNT